MHPVCREGNFNDWASGERGHAHSTVPALLHVTPRADPSILADLTRVTSDGHMRVVSCHRILTFASYVHVNEKYMVLPNFSCYSFLMTLHSVYVRNIMEKYFWFANVYEFETIITCILLLEYIFCY